MTPKQLQKLIQARHGILVDKTDLMVGDIVLGVGVVDRITADGYWMKEPLIGPDLASDQITQRRHNFGSGQWYIAPGPERIESVRRELVELL